MSSLSSSLLEQVNTKYEAYRLIHDPTRLMTLLFSKYGDIEEDYYFLYINQVLFNLPTKFNCVFKEIKYSNMTQDYLKRIYKNNESIDRIPRLCDYYKNYHLFFCRPTLRHYKLGKLMGNYQDKKAEIFYKNNYQESKENSVEKEEENKKSSSFSMSSLDNITNNKTIFDKQTKKILEKSETDLKNNNYYNTLLLETSRSNILVNNGLISKRTGDENSFEKIIHALVDYQYYKNKQKNKNNNNSKKSTFKNKKIKDIIINNYNSNKNTKIKNNISQTQRSSYKLYNYNNYKISTTKAAKIYNNISNSNNSNINSSNRNNYINKIKKSKNKTKKKPLNELASNRYNTSSTTLLNNKYNNNNNNNNHHHKINKIKEFNINFPATTTNKEKNKTYIYSNNNTIANIRNNGKNNSTAKSKILSNSNANSNINIIPNMKIGHEHIINHNNNNNNNYKKCSKLTEYLKQIKENNKNFTQKSSLHKKNCLSIGDSENTNLLFNMNNKNRITKKKITINKNLKITITNGNGNSNTNANSLIQKPKHTKNKTFDYNSINQTSTNNNISKNNNNFIIINEEFNGLIKKPKKTIYNINIDNNNFSNNNNEGNKTKKIFTKINKVNNKKKGLFSPTYKNNNKISVTQNSSKEKNIRNKNLTVKILSPNNKKKIVNNKIINSPQNKKNNKSVFTKENNFMNNKDLLIKSNKIFKSNFSLSPNTYTNNNIDIKEMINKNVANHFSPTNQLFNSIVYFKRNARLNSNVNSNNNIYIKKSINKDNKKISHKKENSSLINSCNFNNTTKDLYPNISLTNTNTNTNTNNICNTSNNIDNKNLSRNKKKISNNNFNISKKNNLRIKTDSNANNNQLNCNFIINDNINNHIINNNGNINISIEKNNINIKDSILHINKIYIKKENSNRKKNKKQKIYDIDANASDNKKTIEIKVGENIIKTDENDTNRKNEKIISMDYSPFKKENSPAKVINVHRNFNLITKNNKK